MIETAPHDDFVRGQSVLGMGVCVWVWECVWVLIISQVNQ